MIGNLIAALFLVAGAIGALVAAALLVRRNDRPQDPELAAALIYRDSDPEKWTRYLQERSPEMWARYVASLQARHAAEFAAAAHWLGLDDVFIAGSGRLVVRIGWQEESAPLVHGVSVREQIRDLDERLSRRLHAMRNPTAPLALSMVQANDGSASDLLEIAASGATLSHDAVKKIAEHTHELQRRVDEFEEALMWWHAARDCPEQSADGRWLAGTKLTDAENELRRLVGVVQPGEGPLA